MIPAIIGAIGSIAAAGVSAAAGGDQGYPQIDPEIAAELQAMGIDIAQFQANQGAQQQAWTQELQQYMPKLAQSFQDAYEKNYGAIEKSMRGYAEDIMAGKTSPFVENLLARQGVTTGRNRNQALEQAKQQLSALNIDPSSPAYADMLRRTMEDVDRRGLEAQSAIMTEFQNPEIARRILEQGQTTERMSGLQMPEVPQTPQQQLAGYDTQRASALNSEISSLEAKIPGMSSFARAAAKAKLSVLKKQQGSLLSPRAPFQTVQQPKERTVPGFYENKLGSGRKRIGGEPTLAERREKAGLSPYGSGRM